MNTLEVRHTMKRVLGFLKKDIVLTAAWLLAAASAFLVPPSAAYIDYIDFRSLGILWSLMMIMQVFRENAVFDAVGSRLLRRTNKAWQLAAALIFLCFFSSMLITNDVALITFVPFGIMTLKRCGREDMLLPVVVLQTIAANLGSMMTPVGNPQNLYLYGVSGMSFAAFVRLVAPYTAVAAALLAFCILLLRGKNMRVRAEVDAPEGKADRRTVAVFAALFVLALLVVLRVVPCLVLVAAVLAATLILCRKSILKVDYALLLTFVGFFIFTGNMGSIPKISSLLNNIVAGHEVIAGVLASQVISNVPAALLISDFSRNISALILGVNFGGLGTLIASMASLISYKQFAAAKPAEKGRYLLWFTVMNIAFLAVLVFCYIL